MGSRGASSGTNNYKGTPLVKDRAKVINASANYISDENVFTFILTDPKTGRTIRPFSRKKSDITNVLERYPIKDFYASSYTTKSADNLVKKMKDLGYKPTKAFIGGQLKPGVNRLYYLFKKQ